jgi:alpha-methylacyl-CoA racemase
LGPLKGVKIVEIAGIGPGQLCGMLLADMGAQVVRVDRIAASEAAVSLPPQFDLMNRSRPAIAVDLKRPEGIELVLELCATADALFEGFRPGVMERLGLAPDVCLARNPKLVYGRMTGWGQEGPLADRAGHDPNYIALAGVLSCIGERGGGPVYPLNLIGDFGGGGVYMALGLLAGIIEAARSGRGQVVDAAMVDGAASLMTLFYGLLAAGLWKEQRGSNLLDGGAPFLRPYETSDGQHVVIGSLEPRFFRLLLERMGIDDIDPAAQNDPRQWPAMQRRFEAAFRTRSRQEWCDALQDTDACFTPVLSLTEATRHPHALARGTYVEVDGIIQPGPAPRFSRTPSSISQPPRPAGAGARAALEAWGMAPARIEALGRAGVLGLGDG